MTCPFCPDDSRRTIDSRAHVKVLLSNPRLMPGHLLIVPRRHVEWLAELSAKERSELFSVVTEYQERIIARLVGGCDVRQHYRPFQKDGRLKVSHVHIHLQPRELHDRLYAECQTHETSLFEDLSNDEIQKMKKVFS